MRPTPTVSAVRIASLFLAKSTPHYIPVKYASNNKLRVGDGYQESIAEGYGIRLIISATPEGDNFRVEGVFFLRKKDHEQLIPISGLFPNGGPTIAFEHTEHFGANAEAELRKPSDERTHFRENIGGELVDPSLFSGVFAPTADIPDDISRQEGPTE